MPTPLYVDVHVKRAITDQLRARSADVLTAQEDGCDQLSDEDLLERARTLGRLLFTQDIRFWAMAEDWQRQGRPFAGLAYAHQQKAGVGQLVRDLELIALASDPADWANAVVYLPYGP
jgi:hypothetical protein